VAIGDEPFGVDVETISSGLDVIERYAFTGEECRALATRQPHRRAELAILWTRKEAALKCTGAGLSTEPCRLEAGGGWEGQGELAQVTLPDGQRLQARSWLQPEGFAISIAMRWSEPLVSLELLGGDWLMQTAFDHAE
jgi:phosphopantetheinyl transferase